MSDDLKNNQPGPKPDLSMETRLLLAFALMGLVLLGTPYFFKTVMPPPAKQAPAAHQKAAPKAEVLPPTPAAAESQPEAAVPTERVSAQTEETFAVETDLYKVVFSNRGAVVRQWILKKFTDDNGKLLELVNTAAESKVGSPFALAFEERKPAVDLNNALFVAKPASDGLGVTYEYADGALVARKVFRFQKNRYITEISTEVTENGAPVPHLVAWRGGFGDPSIANPSLQHTIYFDLTDTKLVTRDAKSAKNGPVTSEGHYSFAGLEDTFFAAVFLPANGGPVKLVTFSDPVPAASDPKEQPRVGGGIGGSGRNLFSAFVGPKDIDILTKINPQLVRIVDFGWFSFLAKPLFYALHFVSDKWIHNWGWAIVVVTIFINFLLFPLKLSNLKSMKKMQAIQPLVAQINEKYKGISMRDPRKQKQNEEMMALYKKHNVNPMGGCLPMAVQIPFFIAFYKVLAVSIDLRHANWLWVTDLSSAEHLPIHVLPILMIGTQFLLQKMTPSTSPDPSQQRMMQFMPLVMGFFFYGLPSGLVLYYLTVNLVGMAQQWFFNRTVTPADLPVQIPPGKKPNGKGKR